MDDALWLFVSTPQWFVQNSGRFDGGPLSAIPTVGVAGLIVGLALALYRRDARLLLFLLPLLLSQLLLILAGISRGRTDQGTADTILYAFLALQAVLALLFIWRIEGARLTAIAFAAFTLCYAVFVAFIAAHAMANSWLGPVPLPY